MSVVLKLLYKLIERQLVICVNASPLQYRHVLFWGEKGLSIETNRVEEDELLHDLLRYERFVIDMLNINLNFSEKQLYQRLKLFLQGNNKCRDWELGRKCSCVWREGVPFADRRDEAERCTIRGGFSAETATLFWFVCLYQTEQNEK